MGYRFWTDDDEKRCLQLKENITCRQLGHINISGVSRNSDGWQIVGRAYVYRVYDRNEAPPERSADAPFMEKATKKGVRGLVICLARYPNNSFDVNEGDENDEIVNPATVWLATHYTGGVRDFAAQLVAEHQEIFHRDYHTLGKDGKIQVALTKQHIFEFILPTCAKSYASEILEEDISNDM